MARVLFVNQSAVLGGGELSLVDIAQELRCSAMVALFEKGPLESRLAAAGVPVHPLRAASSVRSVRRESNTISLAAAVAVGCLACKLARLARGYDLLYANSQKAFVTAALAAPVVRRPLIWHLRDLLVPEHFSAATTRVAVRLANACAARVIANSRATAAAFVAAGGHPAKVRVVYNGIDPAPFDAVTEEDVRSARDELGVGAAPLIGVFGRFHPWKGQHVAIEALGTLPGVHALLVGAPLFGENAYADILRERTRQLGLERRVHFLGFRSDIARLMRTVDIVVHTSTAPEPFGRVLVEGMLAGRVVVASRAGGAVEVLHDGVTGALVEPGNPAALARCLEALLADGSRRRAMEVCARAHASRQFTLNAMVQAIVLEIEAAAA
jgi:glycosyltransferase involved in cell wall biosynthesis